VCTNVKFVHCTRVCINPLFAKIWVVSQEYCKLVGYESQCEVGEVEMSVECPSYDFILFAIFLPKIIRVGGNLTKL